MVTKKCAIDMSHIIDGATFFMGFLSLNRQYCTGYPSMLCSLHNTNVYTKVKIQYILNSKMKDVNTVFTVFLCASACIECQCVAYK
jgi:hypothetical protein